MDDIDEDIKMKMIHHILYYTPVVIVNRWKPELDFRRNGKTKRKRSSLKNLSVVQPYDKTTSCPKRIKKDFPNNLTLQTAEDAGVEFASNAKLLVVLKRLEVETYLASAALANANAGDHSDFQSAKNVSGTYCIIDCDNIHNSTKCKSQKKDSSSRSEPLPNNSVSVQDCSKTRKKENSSVSDVLEEDVIMVNSRKVENAYSNFSSDVIIIDDDNDVNENEASDTENPYPSTSVRQDVLNIEDRIIGHLDKVRPINGSTSKVTETVCVDHHEAFAHSSIANSSKTTEISGAVVPLDNISDIKNVITMGTSVNSTSGVKANGMTYQDMKNYGSAQKSAEIISDWPRDRKRDSDQKISTSDVVHLVNSLSWVSSSSSPSSSTSSSSFSLRAVFANQTETYSCEGYGGETEARFSADATSSVDNKTQSEQLSSVGSSLTENQPNPVCYGAAENRMTSNQTNVSYRRCSYTEEILLLQKFPRPVPSQSKFSGTEENVIHHDVGIDLSMSKKLGPELQKMVRFSVGSMPQSKELVSAVSSPKQQPASRKFIETMEPVGSYDNEINMLVSKKINSPPSKISTSSAVNRPQVLSERPRSVPLSSKNLPNFLQFTKNEKHTVSRNIETDTLSRNTEAKPTYIVRSSVSNELQSSKKNSSLVLSSPRHRSTAVDNDAAKSMMASDETDPLPSSTSKISCNKPTLLRKSPPRNQAVLEMVASKKTTMRNWDLEEDHVLSEGSSQSPGNSGLSFGDELLMLDEMLYSSHKNKISSTKQNGNMKSQTINDRATENAIKLKKMRTRFSAATKPVCSIKPLVKSTLSFASAFKDTSPSSKVAISDRTSRSYHNVGNNLMCARNVDVHPDKTVPFPDDTKVQSFDELSQPRVSVPVTIAMALSSEILSEDTFDLNKLQDFGKVMQEIVLSKIKQSLNVHVPTEVGRTVGDRRSSVEELATPAALASQAHHELRSANRLLPNVIETKSEASEFLVLRKMWLKPENELKKSSTFFIEKGLTGIPFISIFFQRALNSDASLSLEFSNLDVFGLNTAMITSICRRSFTEGNQHRINLIAKILFRFHQVLLVRFSLLNKMEHSPMTTAEKEELTNKIDTRWKRLMMFDFDKLKMYINQLVISFDDRHYYFAFQLLLLRIVEIFTNFLHVRKGDTLHFIIALLSKTLECANVTDERFLRMLRLENLYKITSELREMIVAEESCILFYLAVPMCHHSLVRLAPEF